MIEIGDDDMEENFDDEYDPDEDTDDLIEDDDDEEENWPDFSDSWEMEESDDTEDDQKDAADGPGTYAVRLPGGHEVIVHSREEADELLKKAKQAELDAIKREHEQLKREIDVASARMARRPPRYMPPTSSTSTRKTKIVPDPSTGGMKKVSEAWPDKDDEGEKAEDPTLKMPEVPKKHEWLVKKTEDSYDRSPYVNVILAKKSFFRKPERVAQEQIAVKGRSPKWVSEEIVRKAADIIARKFPEENPIDAYTIAGVHNVEGIKFH